MSALSGLRLKIPTAQNGRRFTPLPFAPQAAPSALQISSEGIVRLNERTRSYSGLLILLQMHPHGGFFSFFQSSLYALT